MKSALGLVVGVSLLAVAAGCDGGSDGDSGGTAGTKPIVVGGAGGTGTVLPTAGTMSMAGTVAMGGMVATAGSVGMAGSVAMGGTGGAGGTGVLAEGVPLTPADGWVDKASNLLGVQGAMFAYADDTSKLGPPAMTQDFTGTSACITGSAAKVDLKCTPVAPAVDCYGTYWGAAIGLNLNQPIDEITMMGAAPMPFDASAIKGFTFTIAGTMIPTSLRFKVEDSTGEFCTPKLKPVKLGPNTFMLSDLITACWKPVAGAATAETAKAGLIKIAWQVVTDTAAAIPFDYCVSDLRAITQ